MENQIIDKIKLFKADLLLAASKLDNELFTVKQKEDLSNMIEKTFADFMYTEIPIEQFIFVEDGSIDVDELISDIGEKNPTTRVVVHRQGSAAPSIVAVSKKED